MTAKDSGAHLVVEISSEMFSDLIRKFVLGTNAGLGLACELWPTPSAVIQLRTNADGEASFGAIRADGSNYDNGLPLRSLLEVLIDFQARDQLHLSNLNLTDAALDRVIRDLSLQEKLDIVLQDSLPRRTSPTTALTDHVSLAEILTGSLDTVIGGFDLRVVGGGTALAIGIFFVRSAPPQSAALAGQDEATFANFTTDFLQGQRFGISVSTELIDRFVLQRAEVQAALRQALPPEIYTPEDLNHFVALSVEPPNRLKLSGRGEIHTEDCGGVDADWWVFLEPFIQDGFLQIRAEFDYDTDFWDGVQVALCILGNVFLGALVGFLGAGFIGAIVGGVFNFPDLLPSGMEGESATATSCGDNCYEITVRNPASADGRLVFALDQGESLSATHIDVDQFGLNLLGDAVLAFKSSALQITNIRPWVHATAQSVCGGGQPQYQPASFLLFNPHQPYEEQFEWPQICSISLSGNLQPHAEVILMPQNAPPPGPFRVHGVHQQLVEVRINPAAAIGAAISGAAIIKTNTPPTTRSVPVLVAAPGEATIEVEPLVLEFEQRDEEIVDLRNLRRRNMCTEPIPLPGNLHSIGASFKIRNAGPGVLHICDLVLTDPNQVFQVNGSTRFSLLAGSETHVPLVLNMNANAHVQYTATVSVISTDANNPQVDVTVRGTALTPPRGINVGGQIVVVDSLLNAACLELALDGGPIIEIPLDQWTDIFTDPPLNDPESINIFEVGVRHTDQDLEFVVLDGRESLIEAKLGGEAGQSLTLLQSEMKTGVFKQMAEGDRAHFHMSSYSIGPESEYPTQKPINALWASGSRMVVATTKELLLIGLDGDLEKPVLLGALKDMQLTRIGGKKRLHGISKDGLVLFSITPEFRVHSIFKVKDALDVTMTDDSLVYLLTKGTLFTIDLSSSDESHVVARLKVDNAFEQAMVIRSNLYLFGNERLTTFDISRPWLPQAINSTRLRNARSISHWGRSITATGPNGTQFFRPTSDGKLASFAHYSRAHWGNGFVADRHHRYLVSLLARREGFKVWRPEVRKTRAFESSSL